MKNGAHRETKRPFEIGFLLIDGFSLMSFASCVEPLRVANLISDNSLYNVRNVPTMGSQAESSNGALIKANTQIGENVDFDLVIVIGDNSKVDVNILRVNQWLHLLTKRNVTLGGVGAGVLMLARAGLMDGYTFALHDEYVEDLARLKPNFKRVNELFYMDQKRISCKGGASAIDMMHALIESHHGANFAESVSEALLFNKQRRTGNISHLEIGKKFGVSQKSIVLTIDAMLNNMNVPLTLDELSEIAFVGPRQLNRLFKENKNSGTMQFYLKLRLEQSCRLLENTTEPIVEIASSCGFKKSAHFAKVFKAEYGCTPTDYRKKAFEKHSDL